VYACAFARGIRAQGLPDFAQRSHWKLKLRGGVPLHAPVEAVRVLPCAGTPDIRGGDVFPGAVAGLGVASESDALSPAEFAARMRTRNVLPTSRRLTEYVSFPLGRGSQAPPSAPQRRHW
jgi:hypothetical protein